MEIPTHNDVPLDKAACVNGFAAGIAVVDMGLVCANHEVSEHRIRRTLSGRVSLEPKTDCYIAASAGVLVTVSLYTTFGP